MTTTHKFPHQPGSYQEPQQRRGGRGRGQRQQQQQQLYQLPHQRGGAGARPDKSIAEMENSIKQMLNISAKANPLDG